MEEMGSGERRVEEKRRVLAIEARNWVEMRGSREDEPEEMGRIDCGRFARWDGGSIVSGLRSGGAEPRPLHGIGCGGPIALAGCGYWSVYWG
jgi:hypothetical protein